MWRHIVYGTNGDTSIIILCEDMQGSVHFTVGGLDRRTINDAALLREWVKNNVSSLVFRKSLDVIERGEQGMARKLKKVGWNHVYIYGQSTIDKITDRVINLEPA